MFLIFHVYIRYPAPRLGIFLTLVALCEMTLVSVITRISSVKLRPILASWRLVSHLIERPAMLTRPLLSL